jgi:hypothetical protein
VSIVTPYWTAATAMDPDELARAKHAAAGEPLWPIAPAAMGIRNRTTATPGRPAQREPQPAWMRILTGRKAVASR